MREDKNSRLQQRIDASAAKLVKAETLILRAEDLLFRSREVKSLSLILAAKQNAAISDVDKVSDNVRSGMK